LTSSSQKWTPGGKSTSIESPGVRGFAGVRDTTTSVKACAITDAKSTDAGWTELDTTT